MNIPFGNQNNYMNKHVLQLLIPSSKMSLTYSGTSKDMRESKIKALDLHRNRSWMLSSNMPKYPLQSNPMQNPNHTPGQPPPSYQKYTRRAQRCADTADTTSTNLEEVKRLKSNNDGTFTLDGNFYPLKAFVPEEIHLGKLLKAFQDMRREKKMKQ